MLCIYTSGFVNDILFSYNASYGSAISPQQPRCNVVLKLTPLMRGIDFIVYSTRRRVLRLEELLCEGCLGVACDVPLRR